MLKHSSSHSFAVLGGTITATILIELLKPLLPDFFKFFEQISEKVLTFTHLLLSVESMNVLLIVTFLGFVWGLLFKVAFVKD